MKYHNNYSKHFLQKRHILNFGTYGFKVVSFTRISENRLNSVIWLVASKLKKFKAKKNYKVWFLVFPNLQLTKLSLESRMGKGKGPINSYASFIKSGTILCEFENLPKSAVYKLLKYLKKKFPGSLRLISRPKQ
uniref:ribosomal protein L16 n=1 Tax=Pseudoceramium tenerrimum TaxID=196911 RepID=UPI002E770E1B|nr:ribosomal protein L16 [Pseudoceramium tenerrimum]WQF69701.1 ribosomal protein L16 [Pseudoceramium tenerrimum]WQF69737.1 ribosomal protein L16 [Pseudoceramium tenerrimum]